MARSPREDKNRDLQRQSVNSVRHGLRRQRPRIKAAAHRRYRRAETQALAQPVTLADDGVADSAESRVAVGRRDRENRYAKPTLADHVTERLIERFLDMVDTFSAGPYRADTQRVRTAAALTAITRERPSGRPRPWLRSTVIAFDALLPEPVFPGRYWHRHPARVERRREWFTAFLDDAPEWEDRLVRWIADHA